MIKHTLLATAALAALLAMPAIAAPVAREIAPIGMDSSQVVWLGRQAMVTRKDTGEILIWDQSQLQNLTRLEGCRPSGLVPAKARHYVVACTEQPRLLVINDVGQLVESWPRPAEERGLVRGVPSPAVDLSGITAMVRDARGGVYVAVAGSARGSDARGKGRIYYLSPGRTGLTQLAANLDYPAGLALSADGKGLYVSEGLSRQVRRFDVLPGQLSNSRVIARIGELHQASSNALEDPWPGALGFNSQGHLYIALPGDSRIMVTSPEGKRLAMIELPVPYVNGFSFSRSDRIMYVTGTRSAAPDAPGSLYEVRL